MLAQPTLSNDALRGAVVVARPLVVDDQYVTRRQGAEHYGVSERQIDRWIRAGRLKAYRVGTRSVRIRLSDLLEIESEIPARVVTD